MSKIHWLWLADKCRPASSEFSKLIEKFGTIDAIFSANFEQYIEAGISERLSEDLSDKSFNAVTPILNYCNTARVGILCYDEEAYPKSLRMLRDPPAVLYYVGKLPDFNRRLCIAIVGTRKMSEYGMRAAYKIAYEVASSGAVVVSGMALGIDGIASCASIAARGTTVAVLGCGIDRLYPKEHFKLREYIKQNGAVITEYPPSTEPRGSNFPVRNRIISGLCQGTVVVDADSGSGAMITAKNAILQGRDIYAVPGNIDSVTSTGTNILIRDGAQAVLCGGDIIKNYSFLYRDTLDVQRMYNAQSRSDFNADIVRDMEVGVRVLSKSKKTAAESSPRKALDWYSTSGAREENIRTNDNNRKTVPSDDTKKTDTGDGDRSARVLATLNEKQRKIFDEIPIDNAITVDYLTKSGYALGDVMSTLTVLEIKGLISSLPGALYVRK